MSFPPGAGSNRAAWCPELAADSGLVSHPSLEGRVAVRRRAGLTATGERGRAGRCRGILQGQRATREPSTGGEQRGQDEPRDQCRDPPVSVIGCPPHSRCGDSRRGCVVDPSGHVGPDDHEGPSGAETEEPIKRPRTGHVAGMPVSQHRRQSSCPWPPLPRPAGLEATSWTSPSSSPAAQQRTGKSGAAALHLEQPAPPTPASPEGLGSTPSS